MPADEISRETIYKTAFEAWKFQVDHFWSNSSYHVVFQLALAAGIWKVFDSKHYWTCAMLSVGALAFTIVWILNTERITEHIRYSWYRLKVIENSTQMLDEDRMFEGSGTWLTEHRTLPGDYRNYSRIVPPIFLFGWLWMLVWSALSLR